MPLEGDPGLGVDGQVGGVGRVGLCRHGGDLQQVGVVEEAAVARQHVHLDRRLGQQLEVSDRRQRQRRHRRRRRRSHLLSKVSQVSQLDFSLFIYLFASLS